MAPVKYNDKKGTSKVFCPSYFTRALNDKNKARKRQSGLKPITYRRITTSNNGNLWASFPNLAYAQNVSLSRKFLRFNYAFGSRYYKQGLTKYPWTEWFSTLGNLSNRLWACQLRDLKHFGHKRRGMTDASVMVQNLLSYGIPEDRAVAAVAYQNIVRDPHPGFEGFLSRVMFGKKIQLTKLIMWPTLYSTDVPNSIEPSEFEVQNNPVAVLERGPCTSATAPVSVFPAVSALNATSRIEHFRRQFSKSKSEQSPADREGEGHPKNKDSVPEHHKEKWQMSNWIKPLQREFFKVEMNEIWYNRRFQGKSLNPHRHKQKLTPPVPEILIEFLRIAFFKQEWFKVATAIEGLCNEASTPAGLGHQRSWIFWNVGFYSILRFENTVDEAFTAVQTFARNFHGMFVPRTYPRRLGVEVAIWLTQEGRFLEGVKFLKEMDVLGRQNGLNKTIDKIRFNPKRDLIDFLFHLILAVESYAIYQRDKSLYKDGLFQGEESDLNRCANVALSAFEKLLEYSTKCDVEITSYLQPLIELTVKCRSAERAKELFDEIVVKYYGNAFVERAYLKFLAKYFKKEKIEICRNIKLRRKFKFTSNPPHWHHQSRAVASYRQRQLRSQNNVKISFSKIPNPSYSW